MKSNHPTKPKIDGPEIHVELIRIPKPIISRKEFVMEKAKFDAEIERLKRRKKIYNRVALAAGLFALLGWLFLLGKAVLEWN